MNMDINKKMFVRFCSASAEYVELGLTTEQLICLHKECILLGTYYNDILVKIKSSLQLALLNNSLLRYSDALLYLNELLPVVSKYGDIGFKMTTYALLTFTYEGLKQYDKTILYVSEVIHLAKKVGSKETEMKAYLCLGRVYLELEQYDKAILFSQMGLDIAIATGDRNGEIGAYEYMMGAYEEMHKYSDAMFYAERSLDIAKKIGDRQSQISACLLLGKTFLEQKQYDESISYCKKCLDVAKKEDNKSGEMQAYLLLGEAYEDLKEYEDAILCCKKSVDIAREKNYKNWEMQAYLLIGESHVKLKQYDDGISYSMRCIDIAMEIGNKQTEVDALLVLVEAYIEQKQYDNAIFYGNKCIDIAKQAGHKQAQINAYFLLGKAYIRQFQYEDAVVFGKKCASIAEETDEKIAEMNAYSFLVRACMNLRQFDDAILYSRKSLDMAVQCGLQSVEADAYCQLGRIYWLLNQYDDAIMYSEKCIDRHLNKQFHSEAYFTLGNVNQALKKYDNAVLYFEKSIELSKQIGNRKTEACAYLCIGEINESLKQYDDAVEFCKKFIDLAEESGEKKVLLRACVLLSRTFPFLKKIDDAPCKKVLRIAKKTGDKKTEMNAHILLANAYKALSQLSSFSLHINEGMNIAEELNDDTAKKQFTELLFQFYTTVGMPEKANFSNAPLHKKLYEVPTCPEQDLVGALDQAIETNDKNSQRLALCRLYNYYESKRQYKKGIQCLEQSKHLQLGNEMILYCYTEIAKSYVSMNQFDSAKKCCEDGLPEAKECENKIQQSRFYTFIGWLYICCSQPNLAEKYLKQAIRCFEVVFESLGSLGDEFKISIIDEYIICYKYLSMVFISTNQDSEALLVVDRCRARALKDLLILNFGMKREARSDEEHILYTDIESLVSSNKFSILFYSLYMHCETLFLFLVDSESGLNISTQNLKVDEIDFLQLIDKAFDKMQVRHVVNCENRSLDEEQCIEDSQHSDCNEEHSIHLSIVKSLVEIASSKQCHHTLDSRGDVSEKKNEYSMSIALEILYYILISQARGFFNQDEIVIIPDGFLYKVPFAALRDPCTGKYLSESKRIRIAPSLATLTFISSRSEDHQCKTGALIIGDPLVGKVMLDGVERDIARLEGAHIEAIVIGNRLSVTPLIGPKATKPAVIERLQQGVSVVHIAAHGILSKATIVLAPSPETRARKIPDEEDYMLTMADVQKAQVRAQLVVLSCCHSGRGEIRAEGVVGMCRAFLASGARAVVASLWAIDDDATLDFMSLFYFYLKSGKSASTSLHLTMNDLRKCKRFSEPKYWAPFFLIGDDVTINVP